jgi:hypothetical protein
VTDKIIARVPRERVVIMAITRFVISAVTCVGTPARIVVTKHLGLQNFAAARREGQAAAV